MVVHPAAGEGVEEACLGDGVHDRERSAEGVNGQFVVFAGGQVKVLAFGHSVGVRHPQGRSVSRVGCEEVVDLLCEAVGGGSAESDCDDDVVVGAVELDGPCVVGFASSAAC